MSPSLRTTLSLSTLIAACSAPTPPTDSSPSQDASANDARASDGAIGVDATAGADAAVPSDSAADAASDAATVEPNPCTGTTFFVATTGNNDTGDGSAARPWRTIAHAASMVRAEGSTIHVNAGEYTESATSQLAPRVCLEGEGASSVVRSTLTAEFTPIIRANSPEGTQGGQRITRLAFDGRMTTKWAVEIRGRSAVRVHDCTFTDFFDSAVVWGGRADSMDGAPTSWATDNSFHHNTVTNSAHCDAVYCRGALFFGGQQGMEIHHNTMTTNRRPAGQNGWPLKGQVNDGYLRGVKIFNNTLTAANNSTFDFAIELFHVSGTEVTDNTLVGSVDSNVQRIEAPYTFSLRVLRNRISHPEHNPSINFGGGNAGVFLEFATAGVEIANNHVRTVNRCVMFTPRDQAIRAVHIHNNLCEGVSGGEGTRFQNEGPFTAQDVRIDNNVFVGVTSGERPPWGVSLPTGAGSSNVRVRNNIVLHFTAGAVTAGPGAMLSDVSVQNNIFFDCGGAGAPVFGGGTPGMLTVNANTVADPMLDAMYRPLAGSPAIDTGIDVGLPFMGAAPDRGYVEVR